MEEKKNISININDMVSGLTKQLEMFGQMSKEESKRFYHGLKITEDVLFEAVSKHLRIKKVFIPILKFIDLSNIKFDKVDIRGIDFRETNANIDIKKVFKKDATGALFD